MANQLTSFCPPRNLVGFVFAALTALFSASPAHATLFDRGGGLIYDDVLNITWLQDATLAASNTFGLATGTNLGTHPSDTSGFQGLINAEGSMNWPGVLFWIDAMNADGGTGFLGFNNWRLPTAAPINGTSFQTGFSNNATTMQRDNAALALYGNPSVDLAGLRPEREYKINAPLLGHAPIRVKSQLAAWQ